MEGQVIDINHLDASNTFVQNRDYFSNPNILPKITPNAPFITSNCPGYILPFPIIIRWICYAEKKSHTLVPFLSTVRSAQQIMGQLVRSLIPAQNPSIQSRDIYIVTVVSCYDRKLEASRRDFLSPKGSQDIDCVLTSQEIYELLQKPSPEVVQSNSLQLDVNWWNQFNVSAFNELLCSSGGVLIALIHHVLSQHPDAVVQ